MFITGWWLGTFFIFHNIWDNPSHWLIFFQRGWNHQPEYVYNHWILSIFCYHPTIVIIIPLYDYIYINHDMLITWYITITMMYILAWYPHYYHINPYVTSGFTAGCPDAMGFRRSSLCHSGHGRSTPAQYLSQVPDGGRWGLGFCWDFLHVFFGGVLTYPPVIKHGLLENPPFIHDFFQLVT